MCLTNLIENEMSGIVSMLLKILRLRVLRYWKITQWHKYNGKKCAMSRMCYQVYLFDKSLIIKAFYLIAFISTI